MSSFTTKTKRGQRLSDEQTAIARQFQIAKQNYLVQYDFEWQPGRFAKHRAMDCGNTRCTVCGNPRRIWGTKTIQELKQDEVTKDFGV